MGMRRQNNTLLPQTFTVKIEYIKECRKSSPVERSSSLHSGSPAAEVQLQCRGSRSVVSLIERRQHDYTWGAGEDMEAIGAKQQAKIPGENLLGAVLMAVRKLINKEKFTNTAWFTSGSIQAEAERIFHRSVCQVLVRTQTVQRSTAISLWRTDRSKQLAREFVVPTKCFKADFIKSGTTSASLGKIPPPAQSSYLNRILKEI